MPFITEELASYLPGYDGKLLIVSEWPKAHSLAEESDNHTAVMLEIAGKIRQVRAELSVDPGAKIAVYVVLESNTEKTFVSENSSFLKSLARLGEVSFEKPQGKMIHAVLRKGAEIYLDLAGSIDIEREKLRLEKEIVSIEKGREAADAKLNSPQFADRAPAELVEAERQKLADYNTRLDRVRDMLSSLT